MQVRAKVGDLVRHANIPSWGLGLVVGKQENKSNGVFVQWLNPLRRIAEKSLEVDIMLKVINENN